MGRLDQGNLVTPIQENLLLTKEYGASHGSRGPCHRNDGCDEPFGLSVISLGLLDLCQQSKLPEKTSSLRPRYHDWVRVSVCLCNRFIVVLALF